MTWQDDLTDNGIMMKESDVIIALSSGINEKAELAGTTVSIQESDFCTSLDSAICELAPSFVDSNDVAFSADLSELCSAAGYNTVVYGAPSDAVILKNGGVRFNSEYVAQRKAILNLFITIGAGDKILATSISLRSDAVFVNKHLAVTYSIEPSDATTNLEWVVDKDKTGTHFSNSDLTVDSHGVVTLNSTWEQGTRIYQKVVDTISGVESDFLTVSGNGIPGYYCAPGDNVLSKLIAAWQGSYTQNGITMTHNSDGTITLNGTSTASNTSYMRFVIWPLGNNKNANNIPLLLEDENCKNIAWDHPVVDFPQDVSTLSSSGTIKLYEVYFMSGSTQLGQKIERTTGTPHHWYAVEFDNTKDLTAVVFGIQVKQGSVLNNVTFDVGIKSFPNGNFTRYGGELSDHLACDDIVLHKTDSTLDFILRCYHNGKFRTYSRGYAFYISSLYFRLTGSLLEDTSLENLITENEIGIIGNTYQLDFYVESAEFQQEWDKTKFGILLIDDSGEIISDVYAINNPDTTGVYAISDQTYSTTFVLDRKINAVVLWIKDTRQRSALIKFNVTLTDITNQQPGE